MFVKLYLVCQNKSNFFCFWWRLIRANLLGVIGRIIFVVRLIVSVGNENAPSTIIPGLTFMRILSGTNGWTRKGLFLANSRAFSSRNFIQDVPVASRKLHKRNSYALFPCISSKMKADSHFLQIQVDTSPSNCWPPENHNTFSEISTLDTLS